MQNRSSKRPETDPNVRAFLTVMKATGSYLNLSRYPTAAPCQADDPKGILGLPECRNGLHHGGDTSLKVRDHVWSIEEIVGLLETHGESN